MAPYEPLTDLERVETSTHMRRHRVGRAAAKHTARLCPRLGPAVDAEAQPNPEEKIRKVMFLLENSCMDTLLGRGLQCFRNSIS